MFAVLLAASCRQEIETAQLSVMSFNIRICPTEDFDGDNSWINRKVAAAVLINDLKPDVFGIQEALPWQVATLDEALPDYERYGVGCENAQARGECNATYWRKDRFEKIESDTFWLSETPDSVSTGWDGAYNRVATWVRLKDKVEGKEILFFNTHLDHIGSVARVESGKLIVSRMKDIVGEGTPVFLTGDFNANYDDSILDPFREYMGNARETALVTDTICTYHNWLKFAPEEYGHIIDHIWFKNAESLSYRTVTESYGSYCVSDHYPIVVSFILK